MNVGRCLPHMWGFRWGDVREVIPCRCEEGAIPDEAISWLYLPVELFKNRRPHLHELLSNSRRCQGVPGRIPAVLSPFALRAQGDIYLLSLKLEIPDGSTGKPRSNPALLPA